MLVVVGLRNPGSKYEGTRHNVGAEVVAVLGSRHDLRLKRGPLRVRAQVGRGRIGSVPVVLAAPNTFMNTSGAAVAGLLRYFKAGPDELLVIHDDIDLPFARLRLQEGGGTGGHNGLKSLVGSLGTNQFTRLKLGVGRPPGRIDPADFVLSRFTTVERAEVDLLVEDAADVVEAFLADREAAVRLAGNRKPT